MATHLVWSGSAGTPDGLTWDTAWLSIFAANAVAAPGDTILVHNTHSADVTANPTLTPDGYSTLPLHILCVNKDSANALSTGAIETCTIGYNIQAGTAYFYGIRFVTGTSTLAHHLNLRPTTTHKLVFEKCEFWNETTGGGQYTQLSETGGTVEFRNCTFRFKNTTQNFRLGTGVAIFNGGVFTAVSSGVLPTSGVFFANGYHFTLYINGFDFSNLVNTFSLAATFHSTLYMSNCKMPTGWTTPTSTITGVNGVIISTNCWTGTENWHHFSKTYASVLSTDNTVYLTGGATDGVTPYSWQVVTNAACSAVHNFESPAILYWNAGTGSAQTVSIAIAADSATALTEADAHLVVQYLGSTATPLASFLSDAPGATSTLQFGDPTAAGTTAQATDAVSAWTGTGGWSAAKLQTLSVSITPGLVGWHKLTVRSRTPDLTFYINPSAIVA